MANILDNTERFNNAYEKYHKKLVNNIFLHEYPSPFETYDHSSYINFNTIADYAKAMSNNINSKTRIANRQAIERRHLEEIEQRIVEYLNNTYTIPEEIARLKSQASDFLGYVKYFNKIFSYYSDYIMSGNVTYQSGYYNNSNFFNSEEIKNTESALLQEFFDKFFDVYFEVIVGENDSKIQFKPGILANDKMIDDKTINDMLKKLTDFNDDILKSLKELKSPVGNNDIITESYNMIFEDWKNNIEKWFISRGLNYIRKAFESKGETFTYSNIAKQYSGYEKIKNIDTPNLHLDRASITGSFKGYLHSEKRWGAIAEENFNLLLNNLLTKEELKLSNKGGTWKIGSTVTGNLTEDNGKQVKADISFGYSNNLSIKTKQKNKSKEISKINFSLKNYNENEGAVKLHSSGKMDTVMDYLKSNIPNDLSNNLEKNFNTFKNFFQSNKFKYYMVNISRPNDKNARKSFNQTIRDIFAQFGTIFALGNFVNANLNRVDFLVINNKIIPGSLIMEKLQNSKQNKIKASSMITTSINYPSDSFYNTEHEHFRPIYKKEPYNNPNTKGKTGVLEVRKKKGENIINHTTFTFSMLKTFKKELEEIATKI